eukprot:TRINITY_DN100497_c0_g1_i1.p1 TRINITY_DN100497_c0_g1~~TRINITY_DN100497_c0_g1_i1.p1  ORF type:complete len:449 (-),score=94.86 TRINITY_DN100497_c0_g1_i1:128-1474(-)
MARITATQVCVVASSLVSHILTLGFIYSFGIFLPGIMEEFDVEKGAASTIPSVLLLLFTAGGIVTGKLMPRLGQRRMGLLGVLLIVVGLNIAAFSVELWMMYSTIITGFGLNFLWMSGLTNIPLHFDAKTRAGASALAVTGSGFGVITFSSVLPPLLEEYGLRDSLRIVSAIIGVSGALCASAYLPPPPPQADSSPAALASPGSPASPASQTAEVPLAKDRVFQVLTVALITGTLGFFMPFAHLASHCQELGLADDAYSLAYQMFGIFSIVGRLSAGILALKMPPLNVWIGGMMAVGALLFGLAMATTGTQIAAVMALYGIGSGPMIALFMPVLADLFGVHRVPMALGMTMLFNGMASFAGPIVAGFVADATGSYEASFCIGGAGCFLAVLQLFVLKVMLCKRDAARAVEAAAKAPEAEKNIVDAALDDVEAVKGDAAVVAEKAEEEK